MGSVNLKPGVSNLQYDLPAALVVFLVALPLCLGVALASGVPAFSGIIAGAVGGIVVGMLSGSQLSVSGPAAGLTIIVSAAVSALHTFEVFLLAVFLAGVIQLLLGMLRAGVIGDFIPSAVIKGMLAAIGLILILKQIPHALGYTTNHAGDFFFWQRDGENTFTGLANVFTQTLSPAATSLTLVSLLILHLWDRPGMRSHSLLKFVPGPLLVVVLGVLANYVLSTVWPVHSLGSDNLVSIPVASDVSDFLMQFHSPDFTRIGDPLIWQTAFAFAVVASIETLLSLEAVDKIDPFKRLAPPNRELFAQGVGNMISGLIGGIPITSVIVRSSANVSGGARTRVSAVVHGFLLLSTVAFIPRILNMIPLCSLAAVLIAVGYKLTRPAIFRAKWAKGYAQFLPFVITILAILLTDILLGVAIGLAVGAVFVVISNFKSAVVYIQDGNNHLVRVKKNLSFIHKPELRKVFRKIPDRSAILIDLSHVEFVDPDNAEIINDFIDNATARGIEVIIKRRELMTGDGIKEPQSL